MKVPRERSVGEEGNPELNKTQIENTEKLRLCTEKLKTPTEKLEKGALAGW